MANKLLILFIISLSQLFSSQWYFDENDFWEVNTSSRASALGGINLNKFLTLSDSEYSNNRIQIYNSSMYDGIIEYNNIFYTCKINDLHILGSDVNSINLAFFNRKLDDIVGTTNIWNDEINPPSNSNSIDNSLIDYYNHNDFAFLVDFFLKNPLGDFGLHFTPSFSKVDSYSSKAISIDLSYSQYLNNVFLGAILNNAFSYKDWSNGNTERFYPSLSLLISREFKKVNYFLEIDNFYINNNNKLKDKIKLGIEYDIYVNSNIRFGYNSRYFSVGLGTNIYNKILFDYSYLSHPELGNSNQITIIFLIQDNSGEQ